MITKVWFNQSTEKFEKFISDLVLSEIEIGDSVAVNRRLSLSSGMKSLSITDSAVSLAKHFEHFVPMPEKARLDALHVALATVHEMDYLITWDYKHIANLNNQSKFEVLSQSFGFELPIICTPEELLYWQL